MKNRIKQILKGTLILIVTFLVAFVIVGSIYYVREYPKQDFDVVLFTLIAGVANTSDSVIHSIITSCIGQLIVLWIILLVPMKRNIKNGIYLKFNRKQKKEKYIQLFPIMFLSKHRILYSIFIIVLAISIFVRSFGVDEYIRNQTQNSSIFEDYYVDARNVKITFPEKKRNLILILGESFENTVLSKENGGSWDYSIMPELEEYALKNTNFSNSNKIGGALQIYGTDYSSAGNVAITSGTPLKTIEYMINQNASVGNTEFLPGLYTLGEVLRDNGYNLEIIMGSDGTFGNRKQYYTTNGNYKIFDVNYAIENGKMTADEKVWWGFEDDKLYEWSKEEIQYLAKQNQPFNYIMLTADTHFVDGYLSPNVENKYGSQYENVHAYSSKCIDNFIKWLQTQSFYEDTTIVILGDHLGMQVNFYEERMNAGYIRTVYNTIINPAIKPTNTKNRLFTSMDMYPTMLASIGVEIEGNRLGLGTNLYSNTPTLTEELGFENFEAELKKKSNYYNHHIVGNEYYTMKQEYDDQRRKEQEETTN